MLVQFTHFWRCLCNYYMGSNTRYTCVTSNPCLCNSHISDGISAITTWEPILNILVWLLMHAYATPTFLTGISVTTTWEPILDILVWLISHSYATPTFLTVFLQLLHGNLNTRYTYVTSNPCLCNSHISDRVCATTTWEPMLDILVWLVIHACATPTFLMAFLQLLHGNQYWIYLCDL